MPEFNLNDNPSSEVAAPKRFIVIYNVIAVIAVVITTGLIDNHLSDSPDYIKSNIASKLGVIILHLMLYIACASIPLIYSLFKYRTQAFYSKSMWTSSWVLFIVVQFITIYGLVL